MSIQACLAGFSRFCLRRGSLSVVNRSNFVGAYHEMKKAIQSSSAPYFVCLWEAGVRVMKGSTEDSGDAFTIF